jgi:hypothetical protein
MTVGIENLQATISAISDVLVVAVKVIKNLPKIQEEMKDIDATEGIQLISGVVINEVPRIYAAFKETV